MRKGARADAHRAGPVEEPTYGSSVRSRARAAWTIARLEPGRPEATQAEPRRPQPHRYAVRWSRVQVVQAIRQRFRAGRPYLGYGNDLYKAAVGMFGTWTKAVAFATTSTSGPDPITVMDVTNALILLATLRPYLGMGQFAISCFAPAVRLHFGTVERAAEAAGLVDWPLRPRRDRLRAARAAIHVGRSVATSASPRTAARPTPPR